MLTIPAWLAPQELNLYPKGTLCMPWCVNNIKSLYIYYCRKYLPSKEDAVQEALGTIEPCLWTLVSPRRRALGKKKCVKWC